jgi:hypothetical protein
MKERIVAAKQAFKKHYPESLGDKREFSVESGLLSLEHFFKRYEQEDENWEVLACEEKGFVTTETGDHELHIDKVVRHRQSDSIYFVDYKTTSKDLTPMFWKKFELSSQITRYTKYIQDKYHSCAGCIIDAVQVGCSKSKEEGGKNSYLESMKNPADYYERQSPVYSAYHKKDMTIVSGLFGKFQRQIFNRTQDAVNLWMKSDAQWEKMIEWSRKEKCFPMALGSICSWCEFYDYCMTNCDQMFLESLYKQNLTK